METTDTAPSFSFPKRLRLHRQRDFALLYRDGRRARGALILLIAYVPPAADAGFKAGFSVRKKIYRRAVDRNRVKRRLRELVRLKRPELADSAWIILQANAGVDRCPWKTLWNEFNTLCTSAGLDRGKASPPGQPAC